MPPGRKQRPRLVRRLGVATDLRGVFFAQRLRIAGLEPRPLVLRLRLGSASTLALTLAPAQLGPGAFAIARSEGPNDVGQEQARDVAQAKGQPKAGK
jgi:hypothetical protein